MKDKKIITIVTLFTIIFTLIGGTLAYLNWSTNSAQATNVTFTVTRDFSCSADGGGSITSADNMLAPADCLNTTYAIQRTVTVTPTINRTGLTVYMDLWLDIEDIGEGLTNSDYFMYALTESPTSCVTNPKASGTFKGLGEEEQIKLLNQEPYTTSGPRTYYLYIWLHKDETSRDTMNQPFTLTFGGQCSDTKTSSIGDTEPIEPDLDDGMVPVVISNDGTVTTVSSTDDSWYNYNNRQWANVVLVNENATTGVEGSHSRSNYLATPGTEVAEEDILAYYVWIPRYSYRMPGIQCSTIEGVNETDYPECYSIVLNNPDDKSSLIEGVYYLALQQGFTSYTMNEATKEVEEGLETGIFNSAKLGFYNAPMSNLAETYNSMASTRIEYTIELQPSRMILSGEEGTIDIKFARSTTEKETGDAVNTYRTHPAFTFGGTEVNGIWVGKFDTTGEENKPTILPNFETLTSRNVSTQFQMSLKFSGGTLSNGIVTFGSNIYGLTTNTDSHMMKNSEWGAVAYLSHSEYGINDKVHMNKSLNYSDIDTRLTSTTGCGAMLASGDFTIGCEIEYGKSSSYPQSTTGNISGVFDMAGGIYKLMMGVLADSNGEPRSGEDINYNSGFNGLLEDDTAYEAGIDFPPSKYYDLYTVDNIGECTLKECGGHTLYETQGWYSLGYVDFVTYDSPWFFRGGNSDGALFLDLFTVLSCSGGANTDGISFRSVVIKGA